MKYRKPGDVAELSQENFLLSRFVTGITCRLIISLSLSVSFFATAQASDVPSEVYDRAIAGQQPKQGEAMTTPSGVTIRFAAPRPPAESVRARSKNPSSQRAAEAEAASLKESDGTGKRMFTPMRTED